MSANAFDKIVKRYTIFCVTHTSDENLIENVLANCKSMHVKVV